jgi:hypothetical protein
LFLFEFDVFLQMMSMRLEMRLSARGSVLKGQKGLAQVGGLLFPGCLTTRH